MTLAVSNLFSFRDATVVMAGMCAFAGMVAAQQVPVVPSEPAAAPLAASPKASNKAPTKTRPSAGPAWSELSGSQQSALAPLASAWPQLTDAHKRKWLALAHSFHTLPENEQQKLHARMVDWAALSTQERNQARQNFVVANRLQADDRMAQWEAYQALSDEEKKRLAAKAYQPRGAAPAIRPATSQKLAIVPAAPGNPANPPKIVVSRPAAIDRAPAPSIDRSESPVAIPAVATDALLATEPAEQSLTN